MGGTKRRLYTSTCGPLHGELHAKEKKRELAKETDMLRRPRFLTGRELRSTAAVYF